MRGGRMLIAGCSLLVGCHDTEGLVLGLDGGIGATCDADLAADPENCGACGHSCQGGSCEAASCRPVVLAEGQLLPTRVAVDGSRVYFTNHGSYQPPACLECAPPYNGDGSVASVPKEGGAVETIAAAEMGPWGLAVDAGQVYWTNWVDETLRTLPAGDAGAVTLAPDLQQPWGIALTPETIYVSAHDGIHAGPRTGGSAPLLIDSLDALSLDLHGDSLYWLKDYEVWRAGVDGGSPTRLASDQVTPWDLAVDETGVYWSKEQAGAEGGTIVRLRDVGGPLEAIGRDLYTAGAIALDDRRLYALLRSVRMVVAVDKDGSAATLLATETADLSGLAIDDCCLYYAAGDRIMKLAKP